MVSLPEGEARLERPCRRHWFMAVVITHPATQGSFDKRFQRAKALLKASWVASRASSLCPQKAKAAQ